MIIEAKKSYLRKWSKSFANVFNWQIQDGLITINNFIKIDKLFAPWYPSAFFEEVDTRLWNENIQTKKYLINKLVCLSKCSVINENFNFIDKKVLQFLNIEHKTIEDIFNSYSKSFRKKIKNARNKLKIIVINKLEDIDLFQEQLIKINRSQHLELKTPCPPFELIRELLDNGCIEIIIAKYQEQIIGFLTLSTDKNIAHIPWAVRDIKIKNNLASLYLWHFCIERAIDRKTKIFSMGTSSNETIYRFKNHFKPNIGILIKSNEFNEKNTKFINIFKRYLKIFIKKVLNLLIIMTYKIYGYKGYDKISKLIWSRYI